MKVTFVKLAVSILFIVTIFPLAHAQTGDGQPYKTGAGLLIDVGEGVTLVGPHVKHFFATNHAGEAGVLFGGGLTAVNVMYQYHQGIGEVQGLQWYLGLGGNVFFEKDVDPMFGIVPAGGLDFKIPKAPLDLFFDWRPKFLLWEGDSEFRAARFGFGLRFTF